VISGQGLKDPDSAVGIDGEMTEVPAELAAVEAAMRLS
jgi:hypothetical protein